MSTTQRRSSRSPLLVLVAVLVAAGFPLSAADTVGAAAPTVVSLTFDDAPTDQAVGADLLTEFGMTGTFYVNSGRVGRAGYLDWSDLEELAAAGHEIAGHTLSHANLVDLDVDEAARQVCNDRLVLTEHGFPIRSFAYPYGSWSPAVRSVVADCGYNSGRLVGGIHQGTSCVGCPEAETLPPADPMGTRTPNSVRRSTTLDDLKQSVTQARQGNGGWVQFVIHHVCDSCGDPYAISPALLEQFLAWLAVQDVQVSNVDDVIGGPVQPAHDGPPPQPRPSGGLVRNPSLEDDADGNGIADCWQHGQADAAGNGDAERSRVSDAHHGIVAERAVVTNWQSGDHKLNVPFDLGGCSIPVVPGHRYRISAWYKSTVARPASGVPGGLFLAAWAGSGTAAFTQIAQTNPPLPPSSDWSHATLEVTVPSQTLLAVGFSIRGNGTVLMDDFSVDDVDQTPPSVMLTSPADGATVSGLVPLSADASDESGIARVDFAVDGTVVGSDDTAPYSVDWDSAGADHVAITARAIDTAGNVAVSDPHSVLVSSADVEPPTSTVECDGRACDGWFAAPVGVVLRATDSESGVRAIRYTLDGSAPGPESPAYDSPLTLTSTATIRFRAEDAAGNVEVSQSRLVRVDGVSPEVSWVAPANGANVSKNVKLTVSASDVGSGIAAVEIYDGPSLLGTATLSRSTYTLSWNTKRTSKGSHTLTVRAVDHVGNATSRSIAVNVV